MVLNSSQPYKRWHAGTTLLFFLSNSYIPFFKQLLHGTSLCGFLLLSWGGLIQEKVMWKVGKVVTNPYYAWPKSSIWSHKKTHKISHTDNKIEKEATKKKHFTVCHELKVQGHRGYPSGPLWSERRPSAGQRFQPPCPPTSRSLRLKQVQKCNCEMCTAPQTTAAQDKDATDCTCSGGSRTGPPGQPGEAASGNPCPVFLRKASWQSHRPGLPAVTTHIVRRCDSYVLYHSFVSQWVPTRQSENISKDFVGGMWMIDASAVKRQW